MYYEEYQLNNKLREQKCDYEVTNMGPYFKVHGRDVIEFKCLICGRKVKKTVYRALENQPHRNCKRWSKYVVNVENL